MQNKYVALILWPNTGRSDIDLEEHEVRYYKKLREVLGEGGEKRPLVIFRRMVTRETIENRDES